MRKIRILIIIGIIFVLWSSLGHAVLSDQQIVIKGPDLAKDKPANSGNPKDASEEICVVGHGADLEKVSDKQKAFVAAFCDALRNIVQMKKGVVTHSNNEKTDNQLISVIDISSSGRIGNFDISSNTRTEDLTLIEDKVIVKYHDIKYRDIIITTINSVLVSPDIEKIKFIQWDDFPQSIGGVEIMDVTFNNDGICEVQLSCKD